MNETKERSQVTAVLQIKIRREIKNKNKQKISF